MPQYQSYPNAIIAAADKILFHDDSATALKTTVFSDFCTAVRTAIDSYFTASTVVPSTAPSAGQLLVGNAGGTAYAPISVSGDITLASTGIATIAASAVTYAKIQNVSAASRLLGRGTAGGSVIREIDLGTNLSMSGNTLNVNAGIGNVVQTADASEADHVFVSGGADKTRVETAVKVTTAGDVSGFAHFKLPTSTLSDDTFKGFSIADIVAAGTIAQWDLVYLNAAGKWDKAEADDPYMGAYPARGVALEAGSVDVALKVGIIGTARNDGWAWTTGVDLYMDVTAGAISMIAPSTSGEQVQKVGFALSATKVFFNFGAYPMDEIP